MKKGSAEPLSTQKSCRSDPLVPFPVPFSKLTSTETRSKGSKQKTEKAISEDLALLKSAASTLLSRAFQLLEGIYDLRSSEIAIWKFLQA